MNLCKYKNLLGKPGEGIHSFQIGGIAVADVLMTVIGSIIFSLLFKWNFLYTLFGLFLLGIFLHRIFCVRTTVDKFLFPNN